jgi:hypothetical protein
MNRQEFREFQFGQLYVSTNGVWRPTYERLYPKEMLREERDEKEPGGDIITIEHVRFALTGVVTAVYDTIPQKELIARMARTRMADLEQIPAYEESNGYFNDFQRVCEVRNNLLYFVANERDEVFDSLDFYILDQEEAIKVISGNKDYRLKAILEVRKGRNEYGPETEISEPSLTKEGVKETFKRIARNEGDNFVYGTKTYVYPSEPRGTRTKAIPEALMLRERKCFAYYQQEGIIIIDGPVKEQEIIWNRILDNADTS